MSISPSDAPAGLTVVLGVGNPLMGDDGLGLAALERLGAQWNVSGNVDLLDGGTWGLSLLPAIEDAARLLIIDAIDAGAAPGTEVRVPRERFPGYCATKLSPHQIDLRDVLELAQLRGRLPRDAVAIGIQPATIELSDGLTDCVRARVDDVVRSAVDVLASWGHACARKGASAARD
jgi:hydrogenase maturation protease